MRLAKSFECSELTDCPGIYVHWCAGEIFRVGRSFSNARKRALEHIRDNTGQRMAALRNNPQAWLILFTVNPGDELHWVTALEVFLEHRFKPSIPSKRRG
jgi:hypothetical protein